MFEKICHMNITPHPYRSGDATAGSELRSYIHGDMGQLVFVVKTRCHDKSVLRLKGRNLIKENFPSNICQTSHNRYNCVAIAMHIKDAISACSLPFLSHQEKISSYHANRPHANTCNKIHSNISSYTDNFCLLSKYCI